MNRKEGYLLSITLLGLSFLCAALSHGTITGSLTGETALSNIAWTFLSFMLLAGAIIAAMLTAKQSERARQVVISKKAFERAAKDKRVAQDLNRYLNEVILIMQNPKERPQEQIGEFHISPRGHSHGGLRVAWGYDQKTGILYIYDFLYHVKEDTYVDDWNVKAANGKIKKAQYEGYTPFSDKLLAQLGLTVKDIL